MADSILDRIRKGWNAFSDKGPADVIDYDLGSSYYSMPFRSKTFTASDKTTIGAIKNRIAVDASDMSIRHVRIDDNEQYTETIKSGFNECLTVKANIDQTGRAWRQSTISLLLDAGVIAIVPVDTSVSPIATGSYDIYSMRTGPIVQWYPAHVKVRLYNEKTGKEEEVIVRKDYAAIVENPFYDVMNEPNSTFQRLIRKVAILDKLDDKLGNGKLDLLFQLPFAIKTEARRQQAEERRKQIEQQLKDSKYGIAYTDGTEHITQLNRSVENNLLDQVKYLETKLYGQMGVSENVLNGTANEEEMLNYYNRTLEPILSSITDNMTRTFLTKTARTQGQRVKFFRDPFRLIESSTLAELADKFTRNEIMSSNEFRAVIGLHKSDDPKADQLINSNLNQASDQNSNYTADPSDSGMYEEGDEPADDQISEDEYNEANSQLDELDKLLDELTKQVQGA